jgi:hypothetical protein
MALSALLLCSLLATASGAASLAEFIDVPVIYQKGTVGSGSSLLEGEISQERADSLKRMSLLNMEVKEMVLENGASQQGLLAPHKKPTVVASALESEGLSGAFEMLEDRKMPELRKALATAMVMKERKSIDHMTLEETLAKQEQLKSELTNAGKKFADLFDEVTTRYSECQKCLRDCPARKYEAYGMKNEKDCMKNCELAICKETWNPLAGSYKQQLGLFQHSLSQNEEKEASSYLFTNYLSEYLQKRGEQSMFYEDEDEDTEIVYDAPTQEQLQQTEEHDSNLSRFLFTLEPDVNRKVPMNINSEGLVLAMEAPEDELARRLSITALEAETKAKRA